jgi:hypothetical protein
MSRSTVKPAFTRNRRPRVVQNDEYAAFIRRAVRAYGRRVAHGDIEALRDLITLATELEAATDTAVAGLRAFGYSWGEIAHRIGVTRQAAWQRWGGDSNA